MAYTIEEFVHLDLRRSDDDRQEMCVKCRADLHENITDYSCSGEPSCSDCYFDELSKLIETHPVGIPTLRR